MSDFRHVFESYGADYPATMARFMDNETMYVKFLDMLFEDENRQRLADALEARDLSAAFEAAHTLKGVAGNMGLTPLFNAVCAIVEPLRAGELRNDYSTLYQAIDDEFKRIAVLREDLRGMV